MEKEDIIKRVISLEFNRLIDYYRDAQEIEAPSERYSREEKGQKGGRRGERDRSDRNDRSGGRTTRTAEKGYSRLFINIGRTDNVNPATLMGLINDFVPGKIRIGRIDLMQNFSFFEVPENDAASVVKSLNGQEENGRRISVEFAQGGGGSSERRDRRSSGGGDGRRRENSSRGRDFSRSDSGKKEHRKGQRKPKYS